jgi:hypothetical protein
LTAQHSLAAWFSASLLRLRHLSARRVNSELRRSDLPDHARLIDLSAALAGGDDRRLPDEFRLDAIDLNRAGYDRLTELLLRNLSSLSPHGEVEDTPAPSLGPRLYPRVASLMSKGVYAAALIDAAVFSMTSPI